MLTTIATIIVFIVLVALAVEALMRKYVGWFTIFTLLAIALTVAYMFA